jgi:hypothetical protein
MLLVIFSFIISLLYTFSLLFILLGFCALGYITERIMYVWTKKIKVWWRKDKDEK